MSYGCAGRRDGRRQSAILRTETELARCKQALTKKKDLAEDDRKHLALKISRAEVCLQNTKANLGKGTRAMSKSS